MIINEEFADMCSATDYIVGDRRGKL